MNAVYITSIGAYLPGKPINNETMESYLGLIHNTPSRLKERILKQNGIRFKTFVCNTSNVFCQHVYLLVDPENRERGLELSKDYSRLEGIRLFYSCN